jgi:hypothetical protein
VLWDEISFAHEQRGIAIPRLLAHSSRDLVTEGGALVTEPQKPVILPLEPANIPEEFRRIDAWVG